jgi:hypothetical protein
VEGRLGVLLLRYVVKFSAADETSFQDLVGAGFGRRVSRPEGGNVLGRNLDGDRQRVVTLDPRGTIGERMASE